MKKVYLLVGILLIIALGVSLFWMQEGSQQLRESQKSQPSQNIDQQDPDRLQVVASFYPLAEVARNVGKDQINVTQVVGSGVNIHDYEPSSAAVAEIISSDLFIYNGYELDPWAENIVPDLEEQQVAYLEASTVIQGLETEEAHGEEHHDEEHEEVDHEEEEYGEMEHEKEGGHHHGLYDPHIWLSLDNMITITQSVQDELSEADPEHADRYQANAEAYIAELQALDTSYQEGLAQCAHREAIVSHDAFSYLGNDYNITFIPVAGLSPHDEPSSQELAALIDTVEELGLEHVFVEPLVATRYVDLIATETGADVLILNPASGLTQDQEEGALTYTMIMEENLAQLQIGLDCQ